MAHPFETLTPDLVLDAVESIGFLSDARVLALNSYENRVYQVGIEDAEPLIAKFYRPQRWTNEAILEEHRFTFELADCEVPVVATETAPVAWMLDQNPRHLVPLGDPVAFANQIIAQLESPSADYLTRPSWTEIALGLEQALLQPAD